MATGYTRWAGRGQWGTSPLSQLWSIQKTDIQTYRHSDTPLTRHGHRSPSSLSGTGNMVFLKDAAETSWHAVRDLTSVVGCKNCQPHIGDPVCHLDLRWRLIPPQPSRMEIDGSQVGKVPSQEPGRCKLSGEACALQVLGQHPALLAGLL